jgi:hypothetical protein
MNPDLTKMEEVRCQGPCGKPLIFEPFVENEDSLKLKGCTCGEIPGVEISLRQIGLQKLEGVTIYLYRLKSE